MSRPIRDALDITTGRKVYLKGHAQATYMSDGRTVETAINEAMQGGGSGVSSADEVYVFEWTGESDNGTLSTDEVTRLWSSKYIVMSSFGSIIPANMIIKEDNACYIEVIMISQTEDGSIALQIFSLSIYKNSGEWNINISGSVCISANNSNLKELGFATTEYVDSMIIKSINSVY